MQDSAFFFAKQVQLLKPEFLRLEGALLKARTFQHQNRCRLFALAYAAGTEFIDCLLFIIHGYVPFLKAQSTPEPLPLQVAEQKPFVSLRAKMIDY